MSRAADLNWFFYQNSWLFLTLILCLILFYFFCLKYWFTYDFFFLDILFLFLYFVKVSKLWCVVKGAYEIYITIMMFAGQFDLQYFMVKKKVLMYFVMSVFQLPLQKNKYT